VFWEFITVYEKLELLWGYCIFILYVPTSYDKKTLLLCGVMIFFTSNLEVHRVKQTEEPSQGPSSPAGIMKLTSHTEGSNRYLSTDIWHQRFPHILENKITYVWTMRKKQVSNPSIISAMKDTNKPNVILGCNMIKGKLTIYVSDIQKPV
jgi:hypothetical protein